MKVQIIENESLAKYADFENCDVWLLNRTSNEELDERIVNIPEVTESFNSSAIKFPLLLSEISNKYFPDGIWADDFSYEVITFNKQNYFVTVCVCDEECIKAVNL